MKAIVARAEAFGRLDPERRIGGQAAGFRIEPELHDHIGAGVVLRRLQDVVVEPGDVRHKGEPVGGVGRYRVGAGGRRLVVERRGADRAVRPERMDRRIPALIVG